MYSTVLYSIYYTYSTVLYSIYIIYSIILVYSIHRIYILLYHCKYYKHSTALQYMLFIA